MGLLQMGGGSVQLIIPPLVGARSLILCRWGLRRFSRLTVNFMQMGATFPRWGPRFKLFSDGGYGSADGGDVLNCLQMGATVSVHTQIIGGGV